MAGFYNSSSPASTMPQGQRTAFIYLGLCFPSSTNLLMVAGPRLLLSALIMPHALRPVSPCYQKHALCPTTSPDASTSNLPTPKNSSSPLQNSTCTVLISMAALLHRPLKALTLNFAERNCARRLKLLFARSFCLFQHLYIYH